MARGGADGDGVLARVRGIVSAALAVAFLLVGPVSFAHWAAHRGDPLVPGTFVRTSDPCGRLEKGCSESGRWIGADGSVRDGVRLEGKAGDSGRVRAFYQGRLPVPADPDAVWTQEALDQEPWLYLGGTVVGTLLVVGWWRERRLRNPGAPATGGRGPGAHRPVPRDAGE